MTKYNPYPTPPITVAIINQSRQSLLGGLLTQLVTDSRWIEVTQHTLEAAAIDYMDGSHILEVVEVADKEQAVRSSWALGTRQR